MKLIPFVVILCWFLSLYIFTGCDTVTIEESVFYEDSTPAKDAQVRQWNDTFKGKTRTNQHGKWTMTVPADVLMNLCIENPRNNNEEACYDGYLLTPEVGSSIHEMSKIDK